MNNRNPTGNSAVFSSYYPHCLRSSLSHTLDHFHSVSFSTLAPYTLHSICFSVLYHRFIAEQVLVILSVYTIFSTQMKHGISLFLFDGWCLRYFLRLFIENLNFHNWFFFFSHRLEFTTHMYLSMICIFVEILCPRHGWYQWFGWCFIPVNREHWEFLRNSYAYYANVKSSFLFFLLFANLFLNSIRNNCSWPYIPDRL